MESSRNQIDQEIVHAISSSFGKDDVDALIQFIEESRCEIEDVYRGICPRSCKATTQNVWGTCVDERCCGTQRERKIENEIQLEQLKKKRKSKAARKRKVNVSKCNFNPQCLVSLGGTINTVLTRNASVEEDTLTASEHGSEPETNSLSNNETKNNSILSHVRKSISVPKKQIKRYFESLSLSHGYIFSTYIQQVTEYHASLLIPLMDDNIDTDSIQLSLPPGIINLGATCYLNSQIQCLTHNLAFQRGVLTWKNKNDNKSLTSSPERSVSSEVGINAAMYNLQVILARLQHTPNNTIDTTDFASSLNLHESEMQDPNEFSRLLLDRMMDLCPALKKLLKQIFEGRISYTTVCMSCKSNRSREEAFMELTLPLPEQNTAGSSSISPKKNTKNKNPTFSIKECLEEYLKVEELHSDNQYHCETCKSKRDAQRSVSFVSLPPVLQIQLSRYVFDIQRNVKRKRVDEAKLPRILNIKQKGKSSEYVLCGVLHHMGTSAYGGHYIAEGMDWTTGVWFEFNDKEVKVLEHGPTGGENEDNGMEKNGMESKSRNGKQRCKKGSEDAYSMFYVEKKYLGKKVREEVEMRADPEKELGEVIKAVKNERKTEYERIIKSQGEYLAHQAKMNQRSRKVLSEMFTPTTPLHLNPSQNDLIWVDGFQLRNFLSCPSNRPLELNSDQSELKSFLSRREHLCSHDGVGLHPRTARRGKLLTKQMYNAYLSILSGEGHKEAENNDLLIMPSSNVWCDKCVISYQNEIEKKYNILMTLLELFRELESLSATSKIEHENSPSNNDTLYAVSSKFLTDLKRYTVKKLREIIKDKTILEEGIDKLSFSEIIKSKSIVESGGDAFMDPYVNSRITCDHGNLKHANGRVIKKINENTWKKIVELFPDAIPHECGNDCNGDSSCAQCDNEQADKELRHRWKQKATTDKCLKPLYKGKKSAIQQYLFAPEPLTLFAVREKVLEVWREAIEYVLEKGDIDNEIDSDFPRLLELLRNINEENWKSSDATENSQSRFNDSIETFFHLCSMHHLALPIPSSLEKDLSIQLYDDTIAANVPIDIEQEEKKESARQRNDCKLKLLTEIEFDELFKSIYSYPIATPQNSINSNEMAGTFITRLKKFVPKLNFAPREDGRQCRRYTLEPSSCFDCTCNCCDQLSIVDVTSSTLKDDSKSLPKIVSEEKNGSDSWEENSMKAIDKPDEPMGDMSSEMIIPVYQIDDNACVESAAENEATSFAASIDDKNGHSFINEWSEGNVVRRSTRKRKSRFQTVFNVRMKRSARLAKFRLLLYERHNKSPMDQQLYLVMLHKPNSSNAEKKLDCKSPDHTVSELPYELNEQPFDSILQKHASQRLQNSSGDIESNVIENSDLMYSSFWIYLKYSERKSKISKREKTVIEESIIDSLLISDDQCISPTVNGSRKTGGKRGPERGFHGTLLQSFVGSSENENIKIGDNAGDNSEHDKKDEMKITPVGMKKGTKKMPISID